ARSAGRSLRPDRRADPVGGRRRHDATRSRAFEELVSSGRTGAGGSGSGRTGAGEPGAWQIWVDTGGTFTDALGVDPLGGLRRVKILSTSALRGAITAQISPTRLKIRTDWSLPDDFIRGFRFRA